MKKYLKTGSIAIFAAAFLWAFGGVFLVPKLYHLDIHLVVLIQHIIPTILFTVGFLCWKKSVFSEIKKLTKEEWLVFLVVAFLGGYLGTYAITQAFFAAYSTGEPLTNIFFLQKLQPIFAILVAIFLLKEKLSAKFVGAGLLALIGSYLLTFGLKSPEISLNNSALIVSGWAALAAFSWGVSTTISKKALEPVSFYTATYVRFFLTTIVVAFIAAVIGFDTAKIFVSAADWKIFILIAFTTGGFALWLYYWGLKKVLASNSAVYEMSMPVFALLLEQLIAPYFLTDFVAPTISAAQISGGFLLILAGLWLAKK